MAERTNEGQVQMQSQMCKISHFCHFDRMMSLCFIFDYLSVVLVNISGRTVDCNSAMF